MPRKSDFAFKEFVEIFGNLLDARLKTAFSVFKLEVQDMIDHSAAELRQDMATKDDLRKLEENMATKDDIKNMATKDDIKNMATKDDIKNMATKDDIARLEQKIDKLSTLEEKVENLDTRVTALEIKNQN